MAFGRRIFHAAFYTVVGVYILLAMSSPLPWCNISFYSSYPDFDPTPYPSPDIYPPESYRYASSAFEDNREWKGTAVEPLESFAEFKRPERSSWKPTEESQDDSLPVGWNEEHVKRWLSDIRFDEPCFPNFDGILVCPGHTPTFSPSNLFIDELNRNLSTMNKILKSKTGRTRLAFNSAILAFSLIISLPWTFRMLVRQKTSSKLAYFQAFFQFLCGLAIVIGASFIHKNQMGGFPDIWAACEAASPWMVYGRSGEYQANEQVSYKADLIRWEVVFVVGSIMTFWRIGWLLSKEAVQKENKYAAVKATDDRTEEAGENSETA